MIAALLARATLVATTILLGTWPLRHAAEVITARF